MGRPERPVDPRAGAVQRFANELRVLREAAVKPTYRVMAGRAGFSVSVLAQAASGERLPSLAVVLAYAQACGADPAEWELRWKAADEEAAARAEDKEQQARDQIPLGNDAFAGDGQLRERPEVRTKAVPRTGHTIRDTGIVLVVPGAPVRVERGQILVDDEPVECLGDEVLVGGGEPARTRSPGLRPTDGGKHVVAVDTAAGDILKHIPMLGDLAVLEPENVEYGRASTSRRQHEVGVHHDEVVLGNDPLDVVLGVGELLMQPGSEVLQRLGAIGREGIVLDVVGPHEPVHDRGVTPLERPLEDTYGNGLLVVEPGAAVDVPDGVTRADRRRGEGGYGRGARQGGRGDRGEEDATGSHAPVGHVGSPGVLSLGTRALSWKVGLTQFLGPNM